MALGVLKYLEERKIMPGRDVGVIGFDDIPFSALPQLGLTTIGQPKSSIGRILYENLLEEIKNREKNLPGISKKILLDPELIVRRTTSDRNQEQ